ncbi:MAG TPA: hypothetical protein VM146_17715 [Steroidobacteraceae bacterium]|nr:hypothetical protein [Steroidobacteraceae bacterium]
MIRNLRPEFLPLNEEVTLSESEFSMLLLLVAGYRVRAHEVWSAGKADRVAAARELEQLEQQRRADLARILGERSAQVLAFEATLPLRAEVRLARMELDETSWPMTDEQSRNFLKAMIATFPDLPATPRSGAENPEAIAQEEEALMDQADSRILRAAQRVMTGAQYAHYAQYLEGRRMFRRDTEDE